MRNLLLGTMSLLISGCVVGLPLDHAEARADMPKASVTHSVFKKYTPYSVVRKKMWRLGWQPVRNANADPCEKDDIRCTGRREMQSCAGTDEANCIFLWKKDARVREIHTIRVPPVFSGSKSCSLQLREQEVQLCPNPNLD